MFMFGDDVPDEVKEAIQRQHDLSNMESQAVKNDTYRLFREVTDDQLGTLQFLMGEICENPQGRMLASFLQGLASAHLDVRGLCLECGERHKDGIHVEVNDEGSGQG